MTPSLIKASISLPAETQRYRLQTREIICFISDVARASSAVNTRDFADTGKEKSSRRQTAHHGGTRMDHVFPDDDAGIEDLKIHVASI